MKVIMTLLLMILPHEFEDRHHELTIINDDLIIETVERENYMFDYFETPFIDEKKLSTLITKLNDKVYEQPMNAKLNEDREIIEEQLGLKLDKEKFHDLFLQYFYKGYPTSVHIPTSQIHPRVNSELLSEISEKRLGYYSTYYQESNLERSHNIYLSTKAINNHVVFPGEEFSFNEIVGERTEEKGYQKAPVIVQGEFSEDIGGGICQVSSTLYNAVHLHGIEIVERYSHSRSVPYVPPGKDATVSWWGPDFVFKNNYNQPILIMSQAKNGTVSIQIFSAEDVNVLK